MVISANGEVASTTNWSTEACDMAMQSRRVGVWCCEAGGTLGSRDNELELAEPDQSGWDGPNAQVLRMGQEQSRPPTCHSKPLSCSARRSARLQKPAPKNLMASTAIQ
jgi:hypothetical protein